MRDLPFNRGLSIEQAYDLYAYHLTHASPAEYNTVLAAMFSQIDSRLFIYELLRIASYLAKTGDDALEPLHFIFEKRNLSGHERTWFHKHYPVQFARVPQGKRMPPKAILSVAPQSILRDRPKRRAKTLDAPSKKRVKEIIQLFHIDCRVKLHEHCAGVSLPVPTSIMPGYAFYVFEQTRARVSQHLADFLGLLVFLGRRARRFFKDFSTPSGSYALTGRTFQALLAYQRPTVHKRPKGYLPYAGCNCMDTIE